MEVKVKKLPKAQVEFEIKVSAQEFEKHLDQATLNLGKDLEVEGFRKGKVPKEIIEKKVGQERILTEAADSAVRENYIRAALEKKIETIGQPEVQILKLAPGNPLEFKARTEILPEVNLPDYKKLASQIKRRKILVEEKEIEDALKWLQKSRAKFSLKNQPAQKGDFVEIEYQSPQIEAMGQPGWKKDAFILGQGHFIPGFEEKLIGMKAGEEKEGISLVAPRSHFRKDLAGKEVVFRVKMNSVQNVEFSEIDDKFAQNLGNFKDLAELKKSIKKGLSLEKENQESERVRGEILEKISQNTKIEIPETLIETEKKRMMEGLKENVSQILHISFEDYLNKLKKSEKELLDSFSSEAQKRVKTFLVLREIGKRERIEITKPEIEEEATKILKQYHNTKEAEKSLDPEKLKEYIKGALKNKKTLARLESFASKS